IEAVMDIRPEAAEDISRKFNIPRHYSNYEEFLDEDIELVIINTPNDCHRDQAVLAFEAGKHCLVQKPLARNVSESQDIIDASIRAGKLLGMIMFERSDPIYHQIRDMVRADCFGTITAVRSALAHTNHMRHPPPPDNWRSSPEKIGGGSFIQLAIHHVDLSQWILGQTVTEVASISSSMIMPERFPKDETTGAVLRYDKGVIGLFLSSFTSVADSLEFFGTNGNISRDEGGISWQSCKPFQGEVWKCSRADEIHTLTMPDLAANAEKFHGCYEPHRAFALAIRGLAPVETPGEIGLNSLKIVEAVSNSAQKGKSVSIEY
ncbi:MAG: Gfo/Idh/MocA family oxidoreductase, partial [bacterium]